MYASVFVVTALLGVSRFVPGADELVHLGVAATFLGVAIQRARREPGGMRRYGIDLAGVLEPPDAADPRPAGPLGLYDLVRSIRAALPAAARELGFALLVALVVFPPFVVGFYAWHRPTHPFAWSPGPDLGSFVLTQLLLVGLPEEALFRGYVQTRLGDAWPTRARVLGTELSVPALLGQAALFAVVHLATEQHVEKLAVFFPGLLFGWMRARRGGIGASIALHALSNVLAYVLTSGLGVG